VADENHISQGHLKSKVLGKPRTICPTIYVYHQSMPLEHMPYIQLNTTTISRQNLACQSTTHKVISNIYRENLLNDNRHFVRTHLDTMS
jgi:hypothetical protein